MKRLRNLKLYLTLVAVIAIAVLLILNEFLAYGIVLIAVALIGFWLWHLFIKKQQNQMHQLEDELKEKQRLNDRLLSENAELRNRKLNISEINHIFDLGLFEINTNFTRTWNDKFTHDELSAHFIGALQVNIIAKYGIDLKELRIKNDPEHNRLVVANINPKFLSFSDLDYDWKIAEIMEFKQQFFGPGHWRSSKVLQGLAADIKEDLRKATHAEVRNGPEELAWVVEPLKKQIMSALELLLGSGDQSIEVVDQFDDSFKSLDQFTASNTAGIGEGGSA